MIARHSFAVLFALCISGCQRISPQPQRIYAIYPPGWMEDAQARAWISSTGQRALYGPGAGWRLINLATTIEDPEEFQGDFQDVRGAAFYSGNRLARLGVRNGVSGWFLPGAAQPAAIPLGASPQWSPDGDWLAYFLPETPSEGIFVGTADAQKQYRLNGRVSGFSWSADGRYVYVMVWHEDGASSLLRLSRETTQVDTIAKDLDAAPFHNSMGIAPDGKHVYVALAGGAPARNEERHHAGPGRDLDIWEIEVASGARRVKIRNPGDEFAPTVANGFLYWTRNTLQQTVVTLPATGGVIRLVLPEAAMPRWHPGARQVSFTFGPWRLVDWSLDLDAGVIDLDATARPASTMRPIVVGFHQDFSPSWSWDGKWIAYHSHRSATAVPAYDSAGSTDDIYLRRAGDPSAPEIRLTDFGFEAGNPEWSPDGNQLIFCTREKGGGPSQPWILTVDPTSGKVRRTERLPLPSPIGSADEATWSADGRQIALLEHTAPNKRVMWLVGVDGKSAAKVVEFAAVGNGGLDWSPDGDAIVYSALVDGKMQLFDIPVTGGTPRALSREVLSLMHPRFSPDGSWIACTQTKQTKEIWRLRL